MGWHITARLAWHDSGWNGHICRDPQKNTYCVGARSYPGDMIAQQRDLEWEKSHASEACEALESVPPCVYSLNAFGDQSLTAYADPPEFFNKDAQKKVWQLPPSTVCVWPYEEMYRDEVRKGTHYDPQERKRYVDEFFSKIEKNSSLVFYYANYSNPLSSDDASRYVLVGLSRVVNVGDDLYYDGCDEPTLNRYGGFVWDRTVTSAYPNEGLRLPYHLYRDDPRVERFAIYPENPQHCKYGSRLLSDDDALGFVEQFHQAVLSLIELGDTSENWAARRIWLEKIIAELWERRGAYPGMAEVCCYLKLNAAIPYLKGQVLAGQETAAVESIWALVEKEVKSVEGLKLEPATLSAAQRAWKLLELDNQALLKNVLSRIDITCETMTRIIDGPHLAHGLSAKAKDLHANPYLLTEQYIGDDPQDRLTWSQLDRAALPSPGLGAMELVGHDSPQRLRALAVECLSRVPGHAFIQQEQLVEMMNRRFESVPEWKRVQFKARYFVVDATDYLGALSFRNENECDYVYLRRHRDAERNIEREIKQLIQRPEIALKIPMTESNWCDFLYKPDSSLARKAKDEYEKAIATQVTTCTQIFPRAFSALCGAAGTGKTTVLASLVKAIRKVDGVGASVMVLAPTGKAADRAREVFERDLAQPSSIETSTIHSFLAKRGWLNDNLTLKNIGGEQETSRQTIIIDECSMLDLHLFATFIAAVKWSTVKRMVMVGDPNQLPPIGTGRVFADIIDYCRTQTPQAIGELTANLRQLEGRVEGKGTGIIDLASLYRQSIFQEEKDEARDAAEEDLLRRVQASGDVDKDLRVLFWQEPEDLAQLLLERLTVDMAEEAGSDPASVTFHELWNSSFQWRPEYSQVLSPYRGELYGIEALNITIQQKKCTEFINRMGALDGIRLFDKVIQLRNRTASDPLFGYDYKTKLATQVDVFNGELGFVGPHGFDKEKWKKRGFHLSRFAVQFARKGDLRVNYGKDLGRDPRGRQLRDQKVEDNLELGYAISVHKAQGSEFERVYVVIPSSHRQLLSQELLYTALTRAKKHCTLLVQRDAGPLIDMRRRERNWLSRINSSLLGWHVTPQQLLSLDGWYEPGKIHRALSQDMVRSKSEVIIANMLHERGINFFYERPLYATDGTMFLPDFTLIWNGEELYWEHVGLISDPKYSERWFKKKNWYDKYFPGKLLVTFESSFGDASNGQGGHLDVSTQADEIIKSL